MTGGVPPIRYAKAGDVDVAYRVVGDGPVDLVWVPGLFSNLEIEWENPGLYARLASFSRLITFDKRGMGLSDRNVGAPTLEERMDDVRAVMDAVESERAVLIGVSEGGPMSLLFAATYPERTVALILYGTMARLRSDADYPHGIEDSLARLREIFDNGWGSGGSLELIAQSVRDDPQARELFGRLERAAGSPGTMRAFVDSLGDIDVRAVLPTISAPTLVIHATDDVCVPIGARISAIAGAGEVVVSRTVTDLVAGSDLEFADRGIHQLKGVPSDWQLFTVTSS